MGKVKYNEMTLLKILALASVLFFHCYRPFLGEGIHWKVVIPDGNPTLVDWLSHLYTFNKVFDVHCLFFCSGFLYFMTMSSGTRTVLEQLIRRSRRIIVPYLTVGLLYFVPLYTIFSVPSGVHQANDSLWAGYWEFLTMHFSDHMWFLQIMLVITVIVLLLNNAFKRFFLPLLLGCFLMTFVFNRYLGDIFFMSLCSMSDNLFLFVLGGAAFRWFSYFKSSANWIIMAVSGAIFFTTYNLSPEKGTLLREINSVAVDGSVCVFALSFARLVADRAVELMFRLRAVRYFDANFMGFYIYHMPIPVVCAMYLYEPFKKVIDSDLLYVITAWIITLLLSALAVRTAAAIKSVSVKVPLLAKLYG